jgi:hypothetical protein
VHPLSHCLLLQRILLVLEYDCLGQIPHGADILLVWVHELRLCLHFLGFELYFVLEYCATDIIRSPACTIVPAGVTSTV